MVEQSSKILEIERIKPPPLSAGYKPPCPAVLSNDWKTLRYMRPFFFLFVSFVIVIQL